jgi:hypothetical protein
VTERVAVLVGNQIFRPDSGLLPLRGPQNDIATLSRILGDPERGRFTVREFLDKPRHEILPEIERVLTRAAPGDLVLIYYSGHGKLDRNGRLCLATRDTEQGALQATSIPARHLTDLVNQSDCDQVVLILDCCYSGAVDDGLRGDIGSEMRVIEDARGFYILTASTDQQTAKETESSAGAPVMGQFTASLAHGIESGAADVGCKGQILLSDLRKYLDRVVAGQTPQFFARRASGDPLISFSPATSAPLLDKAVLADLRAESWHRRLGAVSYLLTMSQDGNPAVQQAAQAELEQHLRGERDVEVRKRIEEGLAPRKRPLSTLEPLPPLAAKKRSRRPVFAALAVIVSAGGAAVLLLTLIPDRGSMSGKSIPESISPPTQQSKVGSSSPELPYGASSRSTDNTPQAQQADAGSLIAGSTQLIVRPTSLLPGSKPSNSQSSDKVTSVNWFVGTWSRVEDQYCGFDIHILKADDSNVRVYPGCGPSPKSINPPVDAAFKDGELLAPLYSQQDRFRSVKCSPPAPQEGDCFLLLTATHSEYLYHRSK